MPKDLDDDDPKKKSLHEIDDEDLDFDEQMEHSGEDNAGDEDSEPKSKGKNIDPLDEEEFDEQDLKAATAPVFGSNEQESAPKPTFKYNVAPPQPSSEPTARPDVVEAEDEHTLDDLTEEDLQEPPKRAFRVERGTVEEPQLQDENSFPRPLDKTAFNRSPGDEEYAHSNLEIPSIRKNNGPFPPHQSSVESENEPTRGWNQSQNYQEPDYGDPQMQQTPHRVPHNPYAPSNDSGNSRFGYSNRQPKGASKWHIIILLLIGGAVIGATVYLLQNQFGLPGKPVATLEPTPNPVVESTPVPTPTPAPLERANFKVRVLNGTTKSGIAKTVLDKLKGLGYQTDRAGNAPKQDYTQTMVRVKEGESTLSAQLTKDLAPDYAIASVEADLKKTDNVDAEIILGEK